jgi:hypothetical protein
LAVLEGKKQSQFVRPLFSVRSPKDSVLRSAFSYGVLTDCERDFTKQSQFVPGLIGATSYVKGIYDKTPLCEVRKNKAKQSNVLSAVEWANLFVPSSVCCIRRMIKK